MTTVLITGFGRFPGAPANPSGPLALSLARTRRLPQARLRAQVLPTTWQTAGDFPARLAALAPDIVLMIGLAARRPEVCVELLGRNASGMFPDARRMRPAGRRLMPGAATARRCAAEPAALLQALRSAGVPARLSRDAGGYICNALAFGAYGWARDEGRLAVFVHIPHPGPGGIPAARMRRGLEALLIALVSRHRRRAIRAAPPR